MSTTTPPVPRPTVLPRSTTPLMHNAWNTRVRTASNDPAAASADTQPMDDDAQALAADRWGYMRRQQLSNDPTVEPSLDEGVYVQFRGPHYETPAEVQMAGRMGGQIVGMSTALEAIAAREAGMEVIGFSLITNLAAGLGEPLSHAEVIAAGKDAEPVISKLLADVVNTITKD